MLKSSSDSENEHDEAEHRRLLAVTSPASDCPSNETTRYSNRIIQTQCRSSLSEANGDLSGTNRSIAAADSTESRSNRFESGDGNKQKRRRLADCNLSNNYLRIHGKNFISVQIG